jgi:hypothetical protein
MDNQDIQNQIDALVSRVKVVEDQVQTPSHYHNGFDSNQIAFNDIYQKKLYIRHTLTGLTATTGSNYGVFFITPVKCLVTGIREVHETAGTDAGAVTLNIEKLISGVAPDSGSTLLSTDFSLKATANVVQTGTLVTTSSTRTLAIGDRLCLKDAGTLTLVAGVTVHIELTY